MRIRKHAKISPLLYTSSSLQNDSVFQTTICHLNQSPWDIITFSPPQTHSFPPPPQPPLLHQGFSGNRCLEEEEEDSFLGNGSFGDSIGAKESFESMKLSFDDNDKQMEKPPLEEVDEKVEEEEEEIFCSKIDSKGWQCHRIAKSGGTLCENHLSRLNKNKNSSSGSNNLARETDSRECEPPRRGRGRPKKESGSGTNGHYYYYSGFGPRWGKRRGAHQFSSCNSNGNNNNNNNNNNNSGSSGNDEGGEILENSARELDYMDEEEGEDGEDERSGSRKKRSRKPIKARSLKSLM